MYNIISYACVSLLIVISCVNRWRFSFCNFMCCPGVCVEALRIKKKDRNQNSLSTSRDMNPRRPAFYKGSLMTAAFGIIAVKMLRTSLSFPFQFIIHNKCHAVRPVCGVTQEKI